MKTKPAQTAIYKYDWPVGLSALLSIFSGVPVALAWVWALDSKDIVISLFNNLILVASGQTVFSVAGVRFAIPTLVVALLFATWGVIPLVSMKHDRKMRANWYWKPAIVGLLLGLQNIGIAWLIFATIEPLWILLILVSNTVTTPFVSLFNPKAKAEKEHLGVA
jgi:hypothetical protein